jgi:hypothetical protein
MAQNLTPSLASRGEDSGEAESQHTGNLPSGERSQHKACVLHTERNHFMKKLLYALCLSALLSTGFLNAARAAEDVEQIPDQVTMEHWACKDIVELSKKYGASGKLPDSVASKGKCPKDEMARCLLSIIDRVLDKCEKEGVEAVPREDRERVMKLHGALRDSLASLEGYQTRRETIEKFLALPEEPPFEYKAGVKGFLRGEGAGNFRLPDLSHNPGHTEGRFLYRVLPYAYWHPTDYLDIHLEGQGYGYTGSNQYQGKVSLYQGFVEGSLPGSDILALKVGRQELVYGSAFILGANSFFQGLTYDAARLRLKPSNALTIDLLGGWYAHPWSDGVNGYLAGVYASYALREGTVLEAYGFADTGSSDHHRGEHTTIWGLRGTATFGPVSLEIEPVYESGRTFNSTTGNNDSIDAWGGHADMTVEAELLGRKNTFFFIYAYGSGSKDAANGISARREFRNPGTDTSLTGDMSLIGDLSGADAGDYHASGLQLFNLGWGIELMKYLSFSATGRYFYANAVPDGFSRRIGLETDFTLTYAVNDSLSVIVGYDRFFTGKFFRDATGSYRDIDYGYAMLQFDLSKIKPRILAKK